MNKHLHGAIGAVAIVLAFAGAAIAQADNFKPTDISNAGVRLAADFAVKERAEKKKAGYRSRADPRRRGP
ncbi:MAG: hypothetical protein IPM21_06120 [Acidobacteria bacterium]|nr:hypothetical protein [Acidobacteriota bacterium]